MKKSALLILAAIFVIGIQSCSTDEHEEISPENLTITKAESSNNKIGTFQCREYVYVYFGNMSSTERNNFLKNAEVEWFDGDQIFTVPSSCPDIEIWHVPCDRIASGGPKNTEDDDEAIHAEGSMVTTQDGGSTTSNRLTRNPVYLETTADYSACVDIHEVDDNNGPIIIPDGDDDDNNPDNNPGLPIRNIR